MQGYGLEYKVGSGMISNEKFLAEIKNIPDSSPQ